MNYAQAMLRMRHLSMIYGGAIAELAKGEEIVGLPTGYPGLSTVRDLADLVLLTRAEVNGLARILTDIGLVTVERVQEVFATEYEWLANNKAEQFGVEVTDYGLVYTIKEGKGGQKKKES